MTDNSPLLDQYQAEFARVAPTLPGANQAWLKSEREQALSRFVAAGFPHSRIESWKYSDTRGLQKVAFRPAESMDLSQDAVDALVPADLDAFRLIFVNGRINHALSQFADLPSGALISGLGSQLDQAAVNSNPESDSLSPHAFIDLNTAFATDGLQLDLSDGIVLERPVYALFIGAPGEDGHMMNIHNCLRLGKNTSATVIEHYVSANGEPYFNNCVTRITLGANAQLKRIRVQQESSQATQVGATLATLKRSSNLQLHSIDLGTRWQRYDSNIRLIEPGAEVHMDGLYVPTGRQHIDNHTCVEHEAPHCISREDYKGILDGGSRGVFNGRIVVHKDAQKTDSEQSSAALLLSGKAEIDAKPELEIYADDVKCKHGATVGQLDERAIFYLQSRGLNEVEARNLLTYSFADELLQRMELPALQKHIEAAVLKKLPDSEQMAELL